MTFNSTLSGGLSDCGDMFADGLMTWMNTSFYFNPGEDLATYASDFFVVVKKVDSSGNPTECFQYGGYDYVYPSCGVVSYWPSTWLNIPGLYTQNADVAPPQFRSERWTVCVGNGWTPGAPVNYAGMLTFTDVITTGIPPTPSPTFAPSSFPTISPYPTGTPSSIPTSAPSISYSPTSLPTSRPSSIPTVSLAPTGSPWLKTSECNEDVSFKFDLSLAGAEYDAATFQTSGHLLFVNIELTFSGSTTGEWPADMAIAVGELQQTGVQVGGFDYYIPNITYAGAWPLSWAVGFAGTYNASINVSQYNIGGSGEFGIIMANAWVNGQKVRYSGRVELIGLVDEDDEGCEKKKKSDSGEGTEAADIYLPIVYALVALIGCAIIASIVFFVFFRGKMSSSEDTKLVNASMPSSSASLPARQNNNANTAAADAKENNYL